MSEVGIEQLLSSVGNGELKAATFLHLPTHLVSPTELKGMVEGAQGTQRRVTSVNVYNAYCQTSYVPIGLVANYTALGDGEYLYERVPDDRALAVACSMLHFSLDMPLSLSRLWGATFTPNRTEQPLSEAVRSASGRLTIFQALSKADKVSGGEIDYEMRARSLHLAELQRLGITHYRSVDMNSINPLVTLGEPDKTDGRTQNIIVGLLKERGGAIRRNELLEIIQSSYKNRRSAQMSLWRLLQVMSESGAVAVAEKVSPGEFSSISLTEAWKNRVPQLVELLGQINESNQRIINAQIDKGYKVLKDPAKLAFLIKKHFTQSRLSQVRQGTILPVEELILRTLADSERGLDTSAVCQLLGDENSRTIKTALFKLKKAGKVSRVEGEWIYSA